jgi:hypothetical protein
VATPAARSRGPDTAARRDLNSAYRLIASNAGVAKSARYNVRSARSEESDRSGAGRCAAVQPAPATSTWRRDSFSPRARRSVRRSPPRVRHSSGESTSCSASVSALKTSVTEWAAGLVLLLCKWSEAYVYGLNGVVFHSTVTCARDSAFKAAWALLDYDDRAGDGFSA